MEPSILWITPFKTVIAECPPDDGIPNKWCNWLNRIKMAAAEVNPLMTAWDKKFTINPARKSPRQNWITPTIKERSNTRLTYFSEPGGARGETPAKTRRDIMATGPLPAVLKNRTEHIQSMEAWKRKALRREATRRAWHRPCLGNQHDGDDQSCCQIALQVLPLIVSKPFEGRNDFLQHALSPIKVAFPEGGEKTQGVIVLMSRSK